MRRCRECEGRQPLRVAFEEALVERNDNASAQAPDEGAEREIGVGYHYPVTGGCVGISAGVAEDCCMCGRAKDVGESSGDVVLFKRQCDGLV